VRSQLRPTVRGRLAVLLAALVVATGLVLLPVTYFLIRANVTSTLARVLAAALHPGAVTPPPQPGAGGTQAHKQVVTHSVVSGVLSALLGQYGLVLAVLVVIAAGVAWLAAGRMLRPLRQMTDTARRITGEDLHERLALSGPADELTELGDTFDAMLARLEAAFTAQQLFAANAAHELRTPLAVMRAELDLLLTGPEPAPSEVREAATRLRRAVLGAERMLERLLTLTRGMLAPGEEEPVPLDQVAGRALADVTQAASERGLSIRAELGEARAYGDASLLGELAGNLVDNAVKYNCPDGWVSVGTHTQGDRVVLEVSNSGPQVAEADLDRLLEPFRRAGQQRTGDGSGLGLSIVRAVVAAHGGELGLRALPEGGLAVRVILPSAPAAGDGHEPAAQAR
jgi:signal transduction histidine kinase